jgi:hypothetical protein
MKRFRVTLAGIVLLISYAKEGRKSFLCCRQQKPHILAPASSGASRMPFELSSC